MVFGLDFDLKQIVLANTSFGPGEIDQLAGAINENFMQFAVLKQSVAELEENEDRTPATAVRLGVCYYLLGRFEDATATLANADGGALSYFYLGKSWFDLHEYAKAIEAYGAAKLGGYNSDACALAVAEAHRYADRDQEAMDVLDGLSGAIEQTAEYLYQRGATIAKVGNNPLEVIALYERAVTVDETHAGALFGLALENDRRGNDVEALDQYSKAAGRFPTHVGALLNLGLLHENRGRFDLSQQCYQRVLDSYPNEPRASLYLKDAMASGDMFYDDEAQKRRDRLSQILSTPVTDFELSVRSRNCLQKMGLLTLGDLARTSEAELLASKNFGETSLVEISEMLTSRNLELGQFAHEAAIEEPVVDHSHLSPDEQAMLDRPIADLNLSVRARKCMARLNLNTIGELLRKTGDEMLECKNFGVTSLNEVREKLTIHSLKLRGD